MNILHLSTHESGGAGKAAYRLHQNSLLLGLNSTMVVRHRVSEISDVIPIYRSDLGFRIKNKIRSTWPLIYGQRNDPNYYYEFDSSSFFRFKKLTGLINRHNINPGVIVAHWTADFLSLKNLSQLQEATKAKLVWYLMDMGAFTGGCHYTWDCIGYTVRCGKCPALFSSIESDYSHETWGKKRDILRNMDITIVAGSSWLATQARNSSLLAEKRIEKILIGVDDQLFCPMPKNGVRERLNLPIDRKIIYFGARYVMEKRKGADYLVQALKMLLRKKRELINKTILITAGFEWDGGSMFKEIIEHRHLGFLANDSALASPYQAADIFVCPSIEDSGPMMINESLMCGTPVVCFDMGVASDLIHSGKTGYRAELKNSEDLKKGIEFLLELKDEEQAVMSKNSRNTALQLCSPKSQAESFKVLFDSLIAPQAVSLS